MREVLAQHHPGQRWAEEKQQGMWAQGSLNTEHWTDPVTRQELPPHQLPHSAAVFCRTFEFRDFLSYPGHWANPFATSRILYLMSLPSWSRFLIYTHLFVIGMALGGGLTSFQVPISWSCFNSISTACCHSGQSYEAFTSLRLLCSSPAVMAYIWSLLRNLMHLEWGMCDVQDELMCEHQNQHTHTTLTQTSLLYVHRVSSSRSLGNLLNTQMLCFNRSSTESIEFAKFYFKSCKP